MAYLHCHTCGWSQDDFWSKDGYNPFRSDIVDHLRDSLFKDNIHLGAYDDQPEMNLSGQEYVARELIEMAKNIRLMYIKTEEEFQLIKKDFACPDCGSSDWDID